MKPTKRYRKTVVALIAAVLLLPACGEQSDPTAQDPPTEEATSEPGSGSATESESEGPAETESESEGHAETESASEDHAETESVSESEAASESESESEAEPAESESEG